MERVFPCLMNSRRGYLRSRNLKKAAWTFFINTKNKSFISTLWTNSLEKQLNLSGIKVKFNSTQHAKFVPVTMVGWKSVCALNKAFSILQLFYPLAIASESMEKVT